MKKCLSIVILLTLFANACTLPVFIVSRSPFLDKQKIRFAPEKFAPRERVQIERHPSGQKKQTSIDACLLTCLRSLPLYFAGSKTCTVTESLCSSRYSFITP